MRFTAYAGVRLRSRIEWLSLYSFANYTVYQTSVVLAAGTVLRAFLERANFYSAAVLIAQSNACLMV